jgi:NAD(P)H-dependent flavin oxidoreductase YrpB (nitropropane dioxygenase family)
MNKYIVCSTLIKNIPTGMTVMTDMRDICALSNSEAVGRYILQVTKEFPEYSVHAHPLATLVEENKEINMKNKDYKVWDCKIVIKGDCELPKGFDSPPRMAAEKAIERAGFEVLANFSGWGGEMNINQMEIVNEMMAKRAEEERNVEIDIEDKDLLRLSIMAHERDITLNDLINHLLKDYIDVIEEKKDNV